MIRHLSITPTKGSALPSVSVTLPAEGRTPLPAVITGPSGAGKSTLGAALVALLTGEAIPGAKVSAETLGGRRLMVSPTRRSVDDAGVTSAVEYRALLAAARVDLAPDLVRLVVTPGELRALATGGIEGRRKLATVLRRAVPGVNDGAVLARLMGTHPVRPDVAPTLKRALDGQRAANSEADRTRGAAEQARRSLEAMPPRPVVPSEGDVKAAREVVACAESWRVYDAAAARWTAYDEAEAAWSARAPGPAPAYDAAEHAAARERVARIEAEERAAEIAAEAEARRKREDEDRRAEEREAVTAKGRAMSESMLVSHAKPAVNAGPVPVPLHAMSLFPVSPNVCPECRRPLP